MGAEIKPTIKVKDIGIAHQQIVEIAKAVLKNTKVLIMDEPTAALVGKEIEAMFGIIRFLKQNGVTIFYISHRLEEIFEICDKVNVLRDGKYVITKVVRETNRKEIISYMVGREFGEQYPVKNYNSNEVLMKVIKLNTEKLRDIDFELKKGEILGIGGLAGAGRTEIARAVFGADKILSGKIIINNKPVCINSPLEAIYNGIGLVPEDRKQQGILLERSVKENITYASLPQISKVGVIDKKSEDAILNKFKGELQIKMASFEQKIKNLSGGNQQKVVLAKWLATKCKIIIFDEPTRGIDVGAKQEIYELIKSLAEAGKGIILISSEMPELLGMSDRIIVLSEGCVTGELSKNEATQEKILDLASLNKGRVSYAKQ